MSFTSNRPRPLSDFEHQQIQKREMEHIETERTRNGIHVRLTATDGRKFGTFLTASELAELAVTNTYAREPVQPTAHPDDAPLPAKGSTLDVAWQGMEIRVHLTRDSNYEGPYGYAYLWGYRVSKTSGNPVGAGRTRGYLIKPTDIRSVL
jgi:hypothetical protein